MKCKIKIYFSFLLFRNFSENLKLVLYPNLTKIDENIMINVTGKLFPPIRPSSLNKSITKILESLITINKLVVKTWLLTSRDPRVQIHTLAVSNRSSSDVQENNITLLKALNVKTSKYTNKHENNKTLLVAPNIVSRILLQMFHPTWFQYIGNENRYFLKRVALMVI